MTTIQQFQRTRSVVLRFDQSSGSNISIVYENNAALNKSKYGQDSIDVITNSYIKNLRAYASIKSIPEVPLPTFSLEESQSERAQKVLDLEWKSPRIQLNCYMSWANQDWFLTGAFSLLNGGGYPYRTYNVMDLYTDNLAIEIGENGRIGIGLSDVGYGLLSGVDLVNIYGSYTEEIIIIS